MAGTHTYRDAAQSVQGQGVVQPPAYLSESADSAVFSAELRAVSYPPSPARINEEYALLVQQYFQNIPARSLPSQSDYSMINSYTFSPVLPHTSTNPGDLQTLSSNQYVSDTLHPMAGQDREAPFVPLGSTELAPVPSVHIDYDPPDFINTRIEISIPDSSTTPSSISSPASSFVSHDWLQLPSSPGSEHRGCDEYTVPKLDMICSGTCIHASSPSASSTSSIDPRLLSPVTQRRASFSGDGSELFRGAYRGQPISGTASAPASRTSSPSPSPNGLDDDLFGLATFEDHMAGLSVEDGASDHSISAHGTVVKQYVGTQAMDNANDRKRTHASNFQCEICPKHFTTKFSMRRHRDTHFGVRHKCPNCDQDFGNRSDRQRHLKKKHGVPSSSVSMPSA